MDEMLRKNVFLIFQEYAKIIPRFLQNLLNVLKILFKIFKIYLKRRIFTKSWELLQIFLKKFR